MYSTWDKLLLQRKESASLRKLSINAGETDFLSNDYLGMARNKVFHKMMLETIQSDPKILAGSTGSRLISGHSAEVHETESILAQKHRTESALLFASGYVANLTLFSCLPQRQDTIIVDEYIHRSVHDGCVMSKAIKWKFRHNNLEDLEAKLKRARGLCFVAVESLYSMEGDFAPLTEIAKLTDKYGASLIVDEAHAFGVFGYGLVHQLGLQNSVFATLITYGKAMGSHGAALLCSKLIKTYLINFGSPFIYSTALPDLIWRQIRIGYEFLDNHPALASNLRHNIRLFRTQQVPTISGTDSPIQSLIVPDNKQLLNLKNSLSEKGLQTYAVFSPTVKLGTERLRICLHTFNQKNDILLLTQSIKSSLDL